MSTASPAPQNERTAIIDIVRGFALAGVLIANFTSYNYQNLPSAVFDSISSPLDKALTGFNAVFFEWKFITTFSILFGYGFGLIITSIGKQGINPRPIFIRRMCWLFVLGAVHTLFWCGDVLHFYAISGLFLLAFRKLTGRHILVFSLLFMFVIPPFISFLFRQQPGYFTGEHISVLYEQYRYGNMTGVFKANIRFYYNAFIVTGADLHDIIETLGKFLFGYFLVRIRLFESIETKKSLFKKIMWVTAPVMMTYFILRWLSLRGVIHTDEIYWEPVMKTGILFTAGFYTAGLVLLYTAFGRTKFFSALQALGKMTLTNYLLVSAVLIVILYGIGLGYLGRLTMQLAWIFALAWLIIEMVFSMYWLHRFRYGPFEWVWRQLTYNKRMPIRK